MILTHAVDFQLSIARFVLPCCADRQLSARSEHVGMHKTSWAFEFAFSTLTPPVVVFILVASKLAFAAHLLAIDQHMYLIQTILYFYSWSATLST